MVEIASTRFAMTACVRPTYFFQKECGSEKSRLLNVLGTCVLYLSSEPHSLSKEIVTRGVTANHGRPLTSCPSSCRREGSKRHTATRPRETAGRSVDQQMINHYFARRCLLFGELGR